MWKLRNPRRACVSKADHESWGMYRAWPRVGICDVVYRSEGWVTERSYVTTSSRWTAYRWTANGENINSRSAQHRWALCYGIQLLRRSGYVKDLTKRPGKCEQALATISSFLLRRLFGGREGKPWMVSLGLDIVKYGSHNVSEGSLRLAGSFWDSGSGGSCTKGKKGLNVVSTVDTHKFDIGFDWPIIFIIVYITSVVVRT